MLNTKPYRVEIHRKDFSYVAHFFLDTIPLVDDYLAPDENTIDVPICNEIERGQWIHIVRGAFQFFGIVSSTRHDVEFTRIGYRPFNAIFAYPVLFNTALQDVVNNSQTYLETAIANLMTIWWKNNTSDATQKLTCLDIKTTSQTTKWTFYIEPDSDNTNYAIVNFLEDIITPAMTQYYIAVNAVPDFYLKKITVTIGKIAGSPYAFEADLPNVISKNIGVYTDTSVINKLIVYNADDYSKVIVFYKHPDGSFDTYDRDRLTPVIYDIETASETEDLSFAYAALARAISRFYSESDSNLIELTYLQNDSLTSSFDVVYGRPITIHSRDKSYRTVLTGIEIEDETVKYIFGVVRVDLTKTLKRRKYNG